jgi:hypothetical protein
MAYTRGWTLAAAALVGCLALAAAPRAWGLHEDQVGSYDWHKQFLGDATLAATAGAKGNKRAFVSTAQGAIGALDLKSGEIGTRVPRNSPSINLFHNRSRFRVVLENRAWAHAARHR